MEITLCLHEEGKKITMVTKKFEPHLLDIDYNKSSKPCDPCALECERINRKAINRKLSEIKSEEVTHIFQNTFKKR